MSYSLGKQRGGACFKVLVEQADGTVREYSGQDSLQGAIWSNIHEKLFHLAESALVGSGSLRGTFGYNAICQTSHEILEGTYDFPPDFDQATKEILQECAAIQENTQVCGERNNNKIRTTIGAGPKRKPHPLYPEGILGTIRQA